jgi:hypothetical protein
MNLSRTLKNQLTVDLQEIDQLSLNLVGKKTGVSPNLFPFVTIF